MGAHYWNYWKISKLPSPTGWLWTALRNEKKLHPRMCFCKEQFLLNFFPSKSKNTSENLRIIFNLLNFCSIIKNNFRISNSYEIRTKLFQLLIFQRRSISKHKITIIRRILLRGQFLWNQDGFKVVSNFFIWNHLWSEVVSRDFGGFFFF